MGYFRRGVGAVDTDSVTIDLSTTEDATMPDQSTAQVTVAGPPYTTVNGICKPTSSDALGVFKDLQRQINRCLSVVGGALLQVDGAIGPATLAAIATIQGSPSSGAYGVSSSNLNAGSCSTVAAQAPTLVPRYSALADYLGAQSSVSSPSPPSTPTYVDPISGQETQQGAAASLADAFNNMSTPMKLAAAGIAGGIAYFTFMGKKGRR